MPVKIKSKNKKANENNLYSKIKPYLKGVVIGDILFIIGVFISGLILFKTEITTTVIYYIPFISMLLGAFFCGVSVQKSVGGRGFLTGILSSVPYLITVLLLICLILKFNVSKNVITIIPICILGGFAGGITAVNSRI